MFSLKRGVCYQSRFPMIFLYINVEECLDEDHNCPPNAICVNVPGSFQYVSVYTWLHRKWDQLYRSVPEVRVILFSTSLIPKHVSLVYFHFVVRAVILSSAPKVELRNRSTLSLQQVVKQILPSCHILFG